MDFSALPRDTKAHIIEWLDEIGDCKAVCAQYSADQKLIAKVYKEIECLRKFFQILLPLETESKHRIFSFELLSRAIQQTYNCKRYQVKMFLDTIMQLGLLNCYKKAHHFEVRYSLLFPLDF